MLLNVFKFNSKFLKGFAVPNVLLILYSTSPRKKSTVIFGTAFGLVNKSDMIVLGMEKEQVKKTTLFLPS